MNKDDTKQAIIGFMEFTKGITGNKDLKIPEDIAKEYGIDQDDTLDNLCNSCTNIGCEFQSGIVRTKCAFYMPPHIEPDNRGKYVVMQPTVEAIPKADYENRLKADMVANYKDIQAMIRLFMYDVNPSSSESDYACNYMIDIIQQKINELKGNKNGNE